MTLKLSTLGNLMLAMLILAAVSSVLVANRTTTGVQNMLGAWQDYTHVNSRKVAILSRMASSLGYGGMVHHFKTYVVRREHNLAKLVETSLEESRNAIVEYRALPLSEQEDASLKEIERTIDLYESHLGMASLMFETHSTAEEVDKAIFIDDEPAVAAMANLAKSVIELEHLASRKIDRYSALTLRFARDGAIAIAVALGVVIAALTWFLVIRLLRPLKDLVGAMEALAGGDINVAVPAIGRGDEMGMVASAVQVFKTNAHRTASMRDYVDNIVSQIREISSQVGAALSQQAATTAQQASSVNQTSAALEQIRETSESTAERADTLSGSAKRTMDESQSGQRQMSQVIKAMSDIREKVEAIAHTMMALSEQTRRVGEITDSVGALAQQSKMLAINASIEAAKAGEVGKGFAVVAEEVANLAERSEQATTQVRTVLDQILGASEKAIFATEEGTKQVDTGVNLINQVSGNMAELIQVIGETVAETRAMVEAIRQQSTGISQITIAMVNVNEGTGQIASSTHDINQAIENLSGLVTELTRARSNLRNIDEDGEN